MLHFKRGLALLGSLLLIHTVTAGILGRHSHHSLHINGTDALDVQSLEPRQGSRPSLRIMPLGASIVYGQGSSAGNGFRKLLRDQLRFKGWNVNYVGSKEGGDMIDRNFEATPGYTIDQVKVAARNSYLFKPNVVLVNVGTNDANFALVFGASARMESMLNEIWGADGMSKTFIVVSSILPRTGTAIEADRKLMNLAYMSLVKQLKANGRPIAYVDMPLSQPGDFGSDGIHPNDGGYFKMAQQFWYAIEAAQSDGLISNPSTINVATGNTCEKIAGQAVYGGITQKGTGEGDGIYNHMSEDKGVIWSYISPYDRNQWFFPNLYGSRYSDLVGWWIDDNNLVTFATWKNNGGGNFAKVSDLQTNLYCIPKGVVWVDLNADGYDDFLCVAPDGNTQASINNRDGTSSKPPTFKFIGVIKMNEGYPQERVRWGDVDGDGRADYSVIDDKGNMYMWRNSGTTDNPDFWAYMGMRFPSQNMGDSRGIRFVDINGDGRDDWLWVSETGATTTFTNSRSCQPGVEGNGMNIYWRQGFWNGATSGPTHSGPGSDGRNRIHFARIYGESAFGMLPKADYIHMTSTKQSDGRFKFEAHVWKNTGSGATKLEADGNKYCNMFGNSDKRMDYVWTYSYGRMLAYPNLGKKQVVGDEVFWGAPVEIFNPSALIGKDLDRRDLHLVDWDNDGVCDIVWTDPNNQNHVSVWINQYKSKGIFTWNYLPNPAPTLYCPEKRGIGFHDIPVRFADISGNGLSDYICLQPDGRFWGWVHETNGAWTFIAQFKKAEGLDRANIRFGNVNGQGGHDMIWLNKWNGDATVFKNNGKLDTGGSNWFFAKAGVQYDGSWAGTCQYFPDLDGDGRADLHSIISTSWNRGETFFNRCGATDYTGDDSSTGKDPKFGNIPSPAPPPPPTTTLAPEPRPTPFVPKALPERAPASDLRYQPLIDIDTDSCYNVATIDTSGEFAEGLPAGQWPPASNCRETWMLARQNVYSRQRCNNGYCIYLYAYYFTKDTSGITTVDAGGHTNDWEHVAVWVRISDGVVVAVGASAHGAYDVRSPSASDKYRSVIMEGGRPKIVYHKDGVGTHAFRFASGNDEVAENAYEIWLRAPLVGHNGWPSQTLRNLVHTKDYGSASFGLKDSTFNKEITAALPKTEYQFGQPVATWKEFQSFQVNVDQAGTNDL